MTTPYIPVENTALIEVRGLFDTVPVENTLYFQRSSAIDYDSLLELCTEAAGWVANWVAPALTLAVGVYEVYGTDLTTNTSPTASYVPDEPIIGDIEGESETRQNTCATSFRTVNRGRSGRGRNYWLGLGISQVTNSQVSSPTIADIISAYNYLVGPNSLVGGWTWGVVSRYLDKEPRTAGLFQAITNVAIVTDLVRSQRGRMA